MKIRIEYLGPFARLTGKRNEVLTLDNECDIITVLKRAGKIYLRLGKEIFDKEGHLKPFVMVIVNNQLVRDLNRKMGDGDSLCIAFPDAGG